MLPNPENPNFVIPIYVPANSNDFSITWRVYPFKYEHTYQEECKLYTTTAIGKHNVVKHGYDSATEDFPSITFYLAVADYNQQILGGFIVLPENSPSTKELWSFIRIHSLSSTFRIYDMRFTQMIFSFGKQFQAFLQKFYDCVSLNELEHCRRMEKYKKKGQYLTTQLFHQLLFVQRSTKFVHADDPHAGVPITMRGHRLDTQRYLQVSALGKEPEDPYNMTPDDTRDTEHTDNPNSYTPQKEGFPLSQTLTLDLPCDWDAFDLEKQQ